MFYSSNFLISSIESPEDFDIISISTPDFNNTLAISILPSFKPLSKPSFNPSSLPCFIPSCFS